MSALRVLVTGATGVVGRRVVPLLVAAGHRVTAVGRTAEKRASLARAGATPIELDMFDGAATRLAMDGHDAIVNLATHIPSGALGLLLPGAWRENDHVRRDGSATLAEAAIAVGVLRFVQESFAPIYADAGDAWIDEASVQRPVRYNRSVLDAEASAERVTAAGGIGVVLRFAYFYGDDSPMLHQMIDVLRRGWYPLPGPPTSYVSSVSHDDAATAVVAALGIDAGAYNVADDVPLTRAEWTGSLARALGLPAPKPMPRWLGALGGSTMELLSRSQRISNAKLRATGRWAPAARSFREFRPTTPSAARSG